MKYSRLLTLLVSVGAACSLVVVGCSDQQDPIAPQSSNESKLLKVNPATQIPGSYIVVLKEFKGRVPEVANEMAHQHGLELGMVWEDALQGFSAKIPEGRLHQLMNDPRVDYVEPDQEVFANVQSLPWGVSATGADSSSTLAGNGSGTVSGVRIYIIDSGIQTNHADLNVVGGINYSNGSSTAFTDGNGHGTHCAGIAAARDNTSHVVGMAPGAALYAVRVLNNQGSGTTSGVISGVNWVRTQKQNNSSVPMVANMSLGGGVSSSLDLAVNNLINAGVVVCVAAGNSGVNATNSSPARVANAITVAAHDANQNIASWSNYGSVVDILAPGVSIVSTYPTSTTATLSGTSMASPHVAGAAALYLSLAGNSGASPATVRNALVNAAQPWINIGSRTGTTNRTLRVNGF